MTQRSGACEAQTHNPAVSSQALYHWATVLPQQAHKIFVSMRSTGKQDLSILPYINNYADNSMYFRKF